MTVDNNSHFTQAAIITSQIWLTSGVTAVPKLLRWRHHERHRSLSWRLSRSEGLPDEVTEMYNMKATDTRESKASWWVYRSRLFLWHCQGRQERWLSISSTFLESEGRSAADANKGKWRQAWLDYFTFLNFSYYYLLNYQFKKTFTHHH